MTNLEHLSKISEMKKITLLDELCINSRTASLEILNLYESIVKEMKEELRLSMIKVGIKPFSQGERDDRN